MTAGDGRNDGEDADDPTVFGRPSGPRRDIAPDATEIAPLPGAGEQEAPEERRRAVTPDSTEIAPLSGAGEGDEGDGPGRPPADATEIAPLSAAEDGGREDPPTQITGAGLRPLRDAAAPDAVDVSGTATQRRKLEMGTVIQGIYRIDGVLKSGGMGAVYRGHEIHTDAPVAIKVILPEFKDDEKAGLLFKREASTLRQLADDAIVRYFAYIYDEQLDRYCIVMEFIAGKQLSEMIGDGRPIGLDDARALLARLARGLAKAHRIGVVHRDLAPDNVMLRDGDVREAVLIDFGIAKSNAVREATMRDQFAGRLRYTSPEQLGRFNMNIGPHTDVYSLALVIAAALRGTPLDMGFTSMADAVDARRDIPDLPDVPLEMVPLLRHMLEPNPANRPASMDRVIELLDDPLQIPRRYWEDGTAPPPAPQASGSAGLRGPSAWPSAEVAGTQSGLQQPPTGTSPLPMVDPPPPPEPEAPSGGRWVWASILLLMALLGGSLWFLARNGGLDPVLALLGGADDRAQQAASADVDEDGGRARVPGTREAFLAEWPEGDCVAVKRARGGANAGGLDGYAADLRALDGVAEDYAAAFGPAALRAVEVAPAQCPALDLARGLQGYGEPMLDIVLDGDSVAGSGEVVGRVLDPSDRELWFAVVTPNGDYAELTSRVGPPVGGERAFRFGFGSAALPEEGVPMVLVAVATDAPSTTLDTAPDRGRSGELFPRLAVRIVETLEGRGAVGLAAYRWLP